MTLGKVDGTAIEVGAVELPQVQMRGVVFDGPQPIAGMPLRRQLISTASAYG